LYIEKFNMLASQDAVPVRALLQFLEDPTPSNCITASSPSSSLPIPCVILFLRCVLFFLLLPYPSHLLVGFHQCATATVTQKRRRAREGRGEAGDDRGGLGAGWEKRRGRVGEGEEVRRLERRTVVVAREADCGSGGQQGRAAEHEDDGLALREAS
jgi:hypothetical protein